MFFRGEGPPATYLLIQNPNDAAADVTVFYLIPSGPVQEAPFKMAANSRKTIKVNDMEGLFNTDTSIRVYSPQGIIAERSMYFNNKGAGTDTIAAYADWSKTRTNQGGQSRRLPLFMFVDTL